MLKIKEQLKIRTESNTSGEIKLLLSDLADFDERNQKLRTFALAQLKPGEAVEFHVHTNECEYYYILSGRGIYNDNGTESEILPGAVTFTPSGTGHGIKNNGKEMLEFIALILLD